MGKGFHITKDQAGRRVDRLLRALWPQVPMGAVMKALRTGEVRLDAKKTKPDARLAEGQYLQVPWDDEQPARAAAAAENCAKFPPLATVYRDDYVWIVNKPAGLLTQPDEKGGDSLITRVLAELDWTRTDFHPSTVQRLDRNTSGVLLAALTGEAQRHLSELIRERRIRKIYRAVTEGETPDSGEIDLPLLKDQQSNMVKVDRAGQRALSRYKRIGGGEGWSAVEIELVTGRPHQARAHLAAIGHPLFGDFKYGQGGGAKRPLLHAYSVTFPDDAELPADIRGRTFTAPLPEDMKKYF